MIVISLQRVRLIVAAKNIPAEEINVHLKVKPDWFVPKINPYGKVPVIEHEGKLIRESLIAFGKYLLVVRSRNQGSTLAFGLLYAIEICTEIFCAWDLLHTTRSKSKMSVCSRLKISAVSAWSHTTVNVTCICFLCCVFLSFLAVQTMWMKYLGTNPYGQLTLTKRLLENCWSVTLAMRYV